MSPRTSITLFRVRGVPVRAHWTLLLILPYLAIVLSLAFHSVADMAGVHGTLLMPPLVWGAILALGLFASVTLHELAHTLLALRFGGRVRSITLMLLGGVSQMTRLPRRSRDEALVALAGPVTSLFLGGLLLFVRDLVPPWPADDLRMGLFYLGFTNLTVGAFNLIPAFPMDGGRILRAALAGYLGPERATIAAARLGRVLAVIMGAVGLWQGSFLLLLIAVFVYSGAGSEELGQRVQTALTGLRVGDLVPVVRSPAPTIGAHARLEEALVRMQEQGRTELVVLDGAGSVLGVLRSSDLALVERDRWSVAHVHELVRLVDSRHVCVRWDASANEALERAADTEATYVVVIDAMQGVLGLLAPRDIETMVTLRLLEQSEAHAPRLHPLARS